MERMLAFTTVLGSRIKASISTVSYNDPKGVKGFFSAQEPEKPRPTLVKGEYHLRGS